MSEEVYGIIKVSRLSWLWWVIENLIFTSNRVIVARLGTTSGGGWYSPDALGLLFASLDAVSHGIEAAQVKKREKESVKLSLESILKQDRHNYVIPNSEIIEVELGKNWYGVGKLGIKTGKKKHAWQIGGLVPEEKGKKIRCPEDYENLLRPVFGDKLSVKK